MKTHSVHEVKKPDAEKSKNTTKPFTKIKSTVQNMPQYAKYG